MPHPTRPTLEEGTGSILSEGLHATVRTCPIPTSVAPVPRPAHRTLVHRSFPSAHLSRKICTHLLSQGLYTPPVSRSAHVSCRKVCTHLLSHARSAHACRKVDLHLLWHMTVSCTKRSKPITQSKVRESVGIHLPSGYEPAHAEIPEQ